MDSRIRTKTKTNRKQKQKRRDHKGTMGSLKRRDHKGTMGSLRNNELSMLPELPNGLKHLYCSNNNISTLPDLPDSLESINLNTNPIFDILETNDIKEVKDAMIIENVFKIMASSKIKYPRPNPVFLYFKNQISTTESSFPIF